MFNTVEMGDDPRAYHTSFAMPSYALLEGFTELSAASSGVTVDELIVGDTIRLRTLNSEYRMVLLDPATRRVIVEGGRLFPAPTEAVIRGSGCGGALLRIGWIGVGLQLEFDCAPAPGQPLSVITSPIEELSLESIR